MVRVDRKGAQCKKEGIAKWSDVRTAGAVSTWARGLGNKREVPELKEQECAFKAHLRLW